MRAPGGPLKLKALVGGLAILSVTCGWLTGWRPWAYENTRPTSVPSPAEGRSEVPDLLEGALEAAEAQSLGGGLESWGRIAGAWEDWEQVSRAAAQAARALGLTEDLSSRREEGPVFRSCAWEGAVGADAVLYLAVQSLGETGDGGETYLLLQWKGGPGEDGMAATLKEWERQAVRAFAEFGVDPHLAYTATGQIPGRLSPEERRRRAAAVLQALQASPVEGVEDEEVLSLSAYSPLLLEQREAREGRVNLQVALRYHHGTGTTYLHIGSPRLGGEY
ncbi:MAG: YwmB family TATA-box binding protein [Thermoanaerobacteraceae bacterium]|nr:YwmB family TATA-box binding protein [Thermoanaerobacteraceae bacterium]